MLSELAATDDCQALRLKWEDGQENMLSAKDLRRSAMDAWSRREVIDHGEIRVDDGLTITTLAEIGGYGVNVHFSDGHERAIYPFSYLRELAAQFDK
ncbi:DUF971 domain-containing protein [Fluviibacterium sp. DFM31]|uniref:DUF971 domain-containing protein n=1 Tax=Meridianimarinicoccus marinus TaxID=3231483 RepID=A0ABV3L621_9RHOB